MWKVFAIFCILGSPCETKWEFPEAVYDNPEECFERALEKSAETIEMLEVMGIEQESPLKIGCEYTIIEKS